MRRPARFAVLLALGTLPPVGPLPLSAQQSGPLAAGTMAPDFALPGATGAGVLPGPVRLSELRDQTVVIAFFYRARTRG